MVNDALEARLLGDPELRWHGQPLEFIPPKLRALLYYLAVQARPVPRSELEEVFWGSGSSDNLRQALHHLRALPGAAHWLETGPSVAVNLRSDLADFEAAVNREASDQALEVWRRAHPPVSGSTMLLCGFKLERSPVFNDWLEVERARIGLLYQEALERRAFELEQVGAVHEALLTVQHLLREDPLNESAYRAAMRLSYRKRQPETARFYYERCCRVLRQELGTTPLPETVALAEHPDLAGVFTPTEPLTLRQALERLPDPRARHGQRYPLSALLGLVLISLLCGSDSLRKVSAFAQEHPTLLRLLGFRNSTPPGRSALSELLDHLDPMRLRQALEGVAELSAVVHPTQSAMDLLHAWALEVQHDLLVRDGPDRAHLGGWLERLGWPELHGWLVRSPTGDGSLTVR